ncbi:MAG TPA: DUF2726 domain-containing protein [Rhodocyclaceae bacterium]|nr:DUF2726 domain-containing protein [Rhodocyclaceae bacterium]
MKEVVRRPDGKPDSEETKEVAKPEKPKSQRAQYRDKFRLMNKSEHQLYCTLVEALPNMIVLSQVSMSQVFHIDRFKKGSFQQLGEIGRKSIDFLICRKNDTSIVTAIELNGPTHEKADQKISDEKKRTALAEAGIPLAIFYPNELPDVEAIRKIMARHIVERRKYEAARNQKLHR